jgi:hypothetical protein
LGVPLLAWQRGPDLWPTLVVPGRNSTWVLEASTGRVAHVIEGLAGPFRAADLNGDGLPELLGYQSARGWQAHLRGRLHWFRGGPPEMWRRLGEWRPRLDRDEDGPAELVGGSGVILGHDGRILKRSTPSDRGAPARIRVATLGLTLEEGRVVARRGDPPQLLWRSAISFPPESVIEEGQTGGRGGPGIVVVRSSGENKGVALYGLDARTGQPRWRHQARSRSAPVLLGSPVQRQVPLVVEHVDGPATVCNLAVTTDSKGRAREVAADTLVGPQEEPVEWVPSPLVEKIANEDLWLSAALALVFLGYTGFRLLRRGYRGLWVPATLLLLGAAYVLLLLLVKFGGTLQPWQRYSWAGWYWILFTTIACAGLVTLPWLGLLFVVSLLRWARRGVARLRRRRPPDEGAPSPDQLSTATLAASPAAPGEGG